MTMQLDGKSMMIGATPASAQTPSAGLSYRDHAKRALDIALVVLSAPVVVPVVLLLALLIAIEGGQPFYCQRRVGRGGRLFRMWKLRSMVRDADARLEAHLVADPAARAEWDLDQKLQDDPRITRVGALIRKTSLDELPQLWNVLMGDMSLVGPRPMMPSQRALYPGHAYFRLRPGLTGPWQVSDRNATSFAARADFDHAYDAALSLFEDVRIIVATFGVVVRATGR